MPTITVPYSPTLTWPQTTMVYHIDAINRARESERRINRPTEQRRVEERERKKGKFQRAAIDRDDKGPFADGESSLGLTDRQTVSVWTGDAC